MEASPTGEVVRIRHRIGPRECPLLAPDVQWCGASVVFAAEDENLLVEEVVQGRERTDLRRFSCFEERGGSFPWCLMMVGNNPCLTRHFVL